MPAADPVFHLSIGELIVSKEPSVISTVLGSCVSVCLYSSKHRVGGMIHYALPEAPAGVLHQDSFRYGDLAIPNLIAELQFLTGESPTSFTAKITGGAAEVSGHPNGLQAGPPNIEIARRYLEQFKIPVSGEDVGGSAGRKVLFHTQTGRLQVLDMNRRHEAYAAQAAKTTQEAKVLSYLQAQQQPTIRSSVVLAIGASTGGTDALRKVMCALPERIPPTLIVQHIPSTFSKPFADRLNELCPFEVKEAENGDELKVSRVLIAPGGKQMRLQQGPNGFFVRITDDAPVNRHKPSVDYLFHTVAKLVGPKAVGVLLTGMGEDGAKGLLDMRSKGAQTIVQDEETSVVYGMPRVAFEMGAAQKVTPLSEIPRAILQCLSSPMIPQSKKA